MTNYKVSHLLVHLGWVDLDFQCSTICLILPRLMGIWQKRLGSRAGWRNNSNQSQTNPSARADGTPCTKTVPRRRCLDGPSPAPVLGERRVPLRVRHADVQRSEHPSLLVRSGEGLIIYLVSGCYVDH